MTTNETKHTPGPWRRSHESIDPEWDIVIAQHGVIVANVNACGQREANARLIAAAPELLEALEVCADALNPENCYDIPKAADKARAAIAKARGQ